MLSSIFTLILISIRHGQRSDAIRNLSQLLCYRMTDTKCRRLLDLTSSGLVYENTWNSLKCRGSETSSRSENECLAVPPTNPGNLCLCDDFCYRLHTYQYTSTVQGLFCVAKGTCFSIQSDFDTEMPTHCAHKALPLLNAHPLIATLSLANQTGQASGPQRAVTITHAFNNKNIKAVTD